MSEIIVKIKRQSKNKQSAARKPRARRRAARLARPEDDYLPRRLSKKGINFYDLGQVLVGGVWKTLDYVVAPPVTDPTLNPEIRPTIYADYAARDALFLDASGALAGNGRRIEKLHGNLFKIKISGDGFAHYTDDQQDSAWTNNGLNLTADELAADNFKVSSVTTLFGSEIQSFTFFPPLKLVGADKNHITSIYNPEAEAVDFTPKNNDAYFLAPTLLRAEGLSDKIAVVIKVGFVHAVYPRFPDAPATRVSYNTPNQPLNSEAAFIQAAQILISIPEVKAFERVGGTYAPYNPQNFPGSFESEYNAVIFYGLPSPPEKFLAAIIKRGDVLFYVWSDF